MDIDLATTLAIVHQCAEREIWEDIGTVVVIAIVHLLALIAIVKTLPTVTRLLRWARSHHLQGLLTAMFVCGFAFYGITKHFRSTVNFPRTEADVWYLMDNGSYVTNDAVHIAYSRNLIVPVTANLFIEALELRYTNETDWAEHSLTIYSNTIARAGTVFDLPFAAATNYCYAVYTDWTPPPIVHTNGVAYVTWQNGAGKPAGDLAMTRTGVYRDAMRLAPSPAITNSPSLTLTINLEGDNDDEQEE